MKFKKEGGSSTFHPIWWWRGGNLHIDHFERLDNDTILLDWQEFKIDKIAAVNPGAYYQCFVYVQTSPMTPTGLYEKTQEEIDYSVENFGYCREEYGIYKGKYKVNRCEYDDGAAKIEGNLTNFNGDAELRVRYISPYNFIIAAQNSPVNNVKFDRILKDLCNKIINGEATIKNLSDAIKVLPKKEPRANI